MIIESKSINDKHIFKADLCLIGSGPANLTIVHHLRNTKLKIIIIPGGKFNSDKQNQNLYKLTFVYNTEASLDIPKLNNIYTTPGIKNVKFIMFSVFDGNGEVDDSPDFEVGRWKLCTSRIYIDIPPNQYPDFSNVGGSDYTTLPWPFTTPIIGGVSEDSKYKKSIQNTLGGGKVGELDIIDERLLVNDLENDEMGKNIETMDLEQCRYFNQSYNMNTLPKELENIIIDYKNQLELKDKYDKVLKGINKIKIEYHFDEEFYVFVSHINSESFNNSYYYSKEYGLQTNL